MILSVYTTPQCFYPADSNFEVLESMTHVKILYHNKKDTREQTTKQDCP